MKIGGFYELQLPRPWTSDSEHRLFKNALDQVELADRSGSITCGRPSITFSRSTRIRRRRRFSSPRAPPAQGTSASAMVSCSCRPRSIIPRESRSESRRWIW